MHIQSEDGSLLEKSGEAVTLANSEEQPTEIQEPDLNSTTFFADREYLDSLKLSFSQKVERINALLLANSLNRPTLFRILTIAECETLSFDELEARIQLMPEFNSATQPPSALIEWLADAEALAIIEVDEEGNRITDEMREEKTDDEIDDLIFDILVEITDYGKGVLEDFDPGRRIEFLLRERPQRYSTYIDLLGFLKEKRSYLEVDTFLRGNPILMDGLDPGARPMQPSVFVDKLSSAGAIIYEKGWIITQEGKHFLDTVSDSAR